MNRACWVNGELSDTLPVTDRGLQYGDGLFETLPVMQEKIPLLNLHLDRLYAGCERLAIPAPSQTALHGELLNAARGQEQAVLKLIVTRGSGGRGYRPPADAQATRILTRHAWSRSAPEWSATGVQLRICDTRLGCNPRLAGLKHLNRLEQVLARAEWSEGDPWQEGLMLDPEGAVIEGTMTNVFVRLNDGRRVTPALHACGVAGVMRHYLLERASQAGDPVQEYSLGLDELKQAEEVMVCNSLVGVWPVRRIGAREYAIGDWIRTLQQWAREAGVGVN